MSDTYKTRLESEIDFYFSITLQPIGCLFNIIALIVFSNKKLNNKNIFGFLYAWLCVFNIICLSNSFIFSILNFFNIEAFSNSDLNCKFIFGWVKYVTHVPSFQMVLVAFYLYVCTCHPSKKEFLDKMKYTIIFITIGLVTLVDCYYTIYYKGKIEEEEQTNIVEVETANQTTRFDCITSILITDFIADMIHIIMRAIVPFLLILILNILTIFGIVKNKTGLSSARSTKNRSKSNQRNRFSKSILGMNFIFIGIYTPWTICFIIFHLNHNFLMFPYIKDSIEFQILLSIFECIAFLNNITPFFLSLAFNSLFRMRLQEMLRYHALHENECNFNSTHLSTLSNLKC
jgi:hypothetical protein